MSPDYDFVIGNWGYWVKWCSFGFKREKRLASFLCQIGWLEIIRELIP